MGRGGGGDSDMATFPYTLNFYFSAYLLCHLTVNAVKSQIITNIDVRR